MFNLSYIILEREDLQSVDVFGDAILDDDDENEPDELVQEFEVGNDKVSFCSLYQQHSVHQMLT
jgi:hypothetical protein